MPLWSVAVQPSTSCYPQTSNRSQPLQLGLRDPQRILPGAQALSSHFLAAADVQLLTLGAQGCRGMPCHRN